MGNSVWSPVFIPLLFSLLVGLAPFTPEPHLVGKIRWLLGGGAGMQAIDYFDIILHGAPWIWLLYSIFTVLLSVSRQKNES